MFRVLLVIAHPDDETIFFGGTILSNPKYIWRILCATYTRGTSRASEMLRAVEAYKAAGSNATVEFLGHRDNKCFPQGGIDLELLRMQLWKIREWPQQVFSHNQRGEYGHPAHAAISAMVESVFYSPWTIVYEPHEYYPDIENNEYLSVALCNTVRMKKLQIFNDCYKTQQNLWTEMAPLMNWAFETSHEVFCRSKPLRVRSAHRKTRPNGL
jgi:LmbE family N-acetylglucosaminyl deacetylase